eukprot:CAMPEP_0197647586 /NCGR_PEP_ID=MMETSP1338-20131121/25848_1 /TAXON_ID=43686 ORGANISM="Pelagodinium beii, Strain RCC1491" /NCGR_SAMPLE_ID=MMETSP1338 /ASSEMBLY_ACC=CAM_ASM_000754 /LENGTH=100 /DNA_ID=CAMNT_0043221415 /DNA_START=44 /DNA_END=342 /DNA_ORIENTATION=+
MEMPTDGEEYLPDDGPCFTVVGGSDSGGIIVREGESTKSKARGERLETGAAIETLLLKGERLKYSKITGKGPEAGWISLTFKEKKLVELCERPPKVMPHA